MRDSRYLSTLELFNMGKFNIDIDYKKSKGSYAWDMNSNKKILDFLSHFSSLTLGYNHPSLATAGFISEISSAATIKMSRCEYYSGSSYHAVEEFKLFALPKGFSHIHFCCTGSLAIEAAIKTAWSCNSSSNKAVLVLKDDFHGINSFGNYLTGCQYERIEDVPDSSWSRQFSKLAGSLTYQDVAAILIEPIQSTAGDVYVDIDLIKQARSICDELNIPLIFDCVQTGFGTTGRVWYWQWLGIEPDIIVFGKKSQVSGIIVKEKFGKIFETPDKLEATFPGDAIDLIRAKYIIRAINADRLLVNAIDMGFLLRNQLSEISELKNVRGIGGITAFDLGDKKTQTVFWQKCFHHGLMVNPTAEKSIRLRPNLAVTESEIMESIKIIKKCIPV